MYAIINKQSMSFICKLQSLEAYEANEAHVVIGLPNDKMPALTTLELKLLYRNLGFVDGTNFTDRDSIVKSVSRMLEARVCTDTVLDTGEYLYAPDITPLAQKSGARAVIWEVADAAWQAAGSPVDLPTVLAMRKKLMQALEFIHGVKKTTSSTALGEWQKIRLK